MDIITPALNAASSLFCGAMALLAPLAGSAASVLAVVLVTLGIRALLVPVGIAQVRADLGRRRIAPQLAELQRRHAKHPERLATAMRALYRRERVSPAAGILPTLAQLPMLSAVYGVFTHPVIGGATNVLLTASLANVPLGTSLLSAFGLGAWGIGVAAVVLVVLASVALLARRQQLRWALARSRMTDAASWLGLAPVAFALVAPVAAGVYLVVSQSWGLAERAVLRRVLA